MLKCDCCKKEVDKLYKTPSRSIRTKLGLISITFNSCKECYTEAVIKQLINI